MAKLRIYKFPDLVLAQKAAPIQRVEKSLYQLADDMLETMYGAPGIGLAANQVGILQRILVLDTEYDLEELPEESDVGGGTDARAALIGPLSGEVVSNAIIKNKKPQIIINPEIISHEGSIQLSEGCLSVPEYYAEVKRAEKLKLRYQDIDGLTKILPAEGLLAVCIQHEMDHLEGRLFIDRLSPLKKEMIRKRLKLERAEREAAEGEGFDSPRPKARPKSTRAQAESPPEGQEPAGKKKKNPKSSRGL